MNITNKEKSNFIDRTELRIDYPHIGKTTPSNNEVRKAISNELKAKEDLIVIKNIKTGFGEGYSKVEAFIYDNLDELKKLEKYEAPKEEPKEKPAENKEVEQKEEIKEDGKEEKTEEQSSE